MRQRFVRKQKAAIPVCYDFHLYLFAASKNIFKEQSH